MIERGNMFGKKPKILVLEDELALSKALCIKLENEGYDTLAVDNGEDAIREIDSRKFDLAIFDLVTPKVDGFGVLKHLREKDEDTPVFVVSNLSQKEDMNEALSKGANKFFVKSNVSLTQIVDDVKEALS